MSDDFKAQVTRVISGYSRPKLQRLCFMLVNKLIEAGGEVALYDMLTLIKKESGASLRIVLSSGKTITGGELINLRDSFALQSIEHLIRSCRDPDKTPTTHEICIMASSYLKRANTFNRWHVSKLLTIAGFISASVWRSDLGKSKQCWINTEKTRDIPTDELASLVRANIEKMVVRLLAGDEDELPS